MNAELYDENDKMIAVIVHDNEDWEHQITMDKSGSIDKHYQDRFPLSPEERSDKQNMVMQQAAARAKFKAHYETNANVLEWDGRINLISCGIETIESIEDPRFRDLFEGYYREVVGDPREGSERERIPIESVQFVYLPAIVDEDEPRFERVGDPSYDYVDENDERQMVGSQPDFEPNLLFQHYVVGEDVPFPDGFRDLLTHHLRCQIRDVYLNMGTEPPPEYDLEGMGKIRIHGRPSIDDEYVTG
jgi:hypothetical protein